MTKNLIYISLIFTVVLSGCSTTKRLPVGQKLYTGADINFTDKDLSKKEKSLLKEDLQSLLRPAPNGKIGPFRIKLWIYEKFKTNKTKGLKHWLSSLGEPPVLVSKVDLVQNSNILQNRLQNRSYFQAQVTGDTVGKEKVAKAVYTVSTGPSYKYRNIIWPSSKDPLDTAVAGTSAQTILKKGEAYNLDAIKAERLRIDARLKEKGFYYFAPENLILRVDSTIEGHQIDATVKVKDEVSERARRVYTINKIYVYPAYSLRDTALRLDSAVPYNWYNVIDSRRRRTIRPYVFKNTVLLHPGEVYNRTDHNNSLNRFIELGPYKFVKNRFDDVSADSAKLNAFYFLTQYPKKSLSLDLLGRTTSANYNGTQVNLNWRNRNAFLGAEALTITLFGSTDGQISGQFGGGHALSQVGVNATLSWPRFISPFNFKADNAYIPRTNLSAGYSIINRSGLYNLSSINGSFGYQWKQNAHKTHELNLLNVTYVKPTNVDTAYTTNIEVTQNPALKHVIDPQFTFGPSYSYTYTNTTETFRTNSVYYNGRVSTSGMLTGLLTGADTVGGSPKKVFGTYFNQYIKLENEIRFFHKLGAKSTFAARMIASAGIPMGNSTILPYSQQFFIGGANSLRGFRARSIGPGTVDPSQYINGSSGFIADQSGDIKLEASIEYRPHLFSIVYGAIFADAGNIWNARGHQPGGTFSSKFLSQLAADVGAGLRFDASVLVLRTDFGFPIMKPFTQSNNTVNYDKMVFNLAIGYPF